MRYLIIGIGACFTVLYVLLLPRRPRYALLVAVGMLCSHFGLDAYVNPNNIVFVNKLLIMIAAVWSIVLHGPNSLSKWPIGLLGALFIFTFCVATGTFSDAYTPWSLLTAFASILTGFLLLYVKWDEKMVSMGMKMICWMAPVCMLVGFVLSGQLYSVAHGPATSIMGGVRWMDFFCFFSILAVYFLRQREPDREYTHLFYLNMIILLLTKSRTATLCAALLAIPFMLKVFIPFKRSTAIVSAVGLPAVAVTGYYAFGEMLDRTLSVETSVGDTVINTSGRLYAWRMLWETGAQRRIAGFGIGYIKTMDEHFIQPHFISPHNEYLRFLFEGGIIGFLLLGTALALVFWQVYKRQQPQNRFFMIVFFVAFAIFAAFDSPISATQFWTPFCMLLSFVGGKEIVTQGEASTSAAQLPGAPPA